MIVFNSRYAYDICTGRQVNDFGLSSDILHSGFSEAFVIDFVTECRRRLSVVNNVGNDAFTLDVSCARRSSLARYCSV